MRIRRATSVATLAVLLLAAVPVRATAPMSGTAQSKDAAAMVRALLTLEASDLNGRTWTHSDLRGRITLVDFWATWCAPCRRELPFMKRAQEMYGDEFQILGVSLDTFSRSELTDWLNLYDIGWPQIHARRGFDDRLAVAFGVDRLPLNILLDQSGKLRAVNVRGRDLFLEIEQLRPTRPASDTGSGSRH